MIGLYLRICYVSFTDTIGVSFKDMLGLFCDHDKSDFAVMFCPFFADMACVYFGFDSCILQIEMNHFQGYGRSLLQI